MLQNNLHRMNENHIHPFLCTLVALTLTVGTARAQQDVLTGQYLFNGLLINPAYAGVSGQWETMAMQRL